MQPSPSSWPLIGSDVAYTDLLPEAADDPVRAGIEAAGGRALYVESDLADLSGHEPLIEAVVGWGGGLDVLVNNAGIGSPRRGDLLSLTPQDFDLVMGVNLRGTFFLSQRAAAVDGGASARRWLPPLHRHHRLR